MLVFPPGSESQFLSNPRSLKHARSGGEWPQPPSPSTPTPTVPRGTVATPHRPSGALPTAGTSAEVDARPRSPFPVSTHLSLSSTHTYVITSESVTTLSSLCTACTARQPPPFASAPLSTSHRTGPCRSAALLQRTALAHKLRRSHCIHCIAQHTSCTHFKSA